MAANPRMSIGALVLSASALVGIALSEGYEEVAKPPVKGDVPTVGFGTTGGVKLGDRTTPEKALARALVDINKFEGAVKQCVTVPLHQYEYDAYIELSYNIGSSAFCGSTLVKKLNASDYEGACDEIRKWVYFKGKKLDGLVNRRERERNKCIGNEQSHAYG